MLKPLAYLSLVFVTLISTKQHSAPTMDAVSARASGSPLELLRELRGGLECRDRAPLRTTVSFYIARVKSRNQTILPWLNSAAIPDPIQAQTAIASNPYWTKISRNSSPQF